MLKKDCFAWDPEAQIAFDALKKAMVDLPALAMPNFERMFVIESDASGRGVGAVLMQDSRPLAFMSKVLLECAQKKSVYEREPMVIMLAIQRWGHYLLGRHFEVHTDQKNLKFLLDQRLMGEDKHKWVSKLLGYDFKVKYKPRKQNGVADALSKKMYFTAISSMQFFDWEGIEEELLADDKMKRVLQDLVDKPNSQPGFKLRQGRLLYKGRVVLARHSPRIPSILKEFHDTAAGGHFRFFWTYKRISAVLFWKGMKKDIQQYVQACETCQQNKYETLSPGVYYNP